MDFWFMTLCSLARIVEELIISVFILSPTRLCDPDDGGSIFL